MNELNKLKECQLEKQTRNAKPINTAKASRLCMVMCTMGWNQGFRQPAIIDYTAEMPKRSMPTFKLYKCEAVVSQEGIRSKARL
jgi:hypothetical protein